MNHTKFANLSTNLVLDGNGIWGIQGALSKQSISYPEDGSQRYFHVEDNSFWFRHRNNCILAAIKRFPPSGPVLDIGGGNGYVTRRIIDEGYEAALLEPSMVGAINAKTKRDIAEVLCCTLEDADFPPASISAIGCFDVMEHIEDDRSFVEKIHVLLQPEGMLYLTVPSHKWLWSQSDVIACHFRRYNKATIMKLLNDRFDIILVTYFFKSLMLPIFLLRAIPYRLGYRRQKRLSISKLDYAHRMGNILLDAFLTREVGRILRGLSISIGTSCLCVARKKII